MAGIPSGSVHPLALMVLEMTHLPYVREMNLLLYLIWIGATPSPEVYLELPLPPFSLPSPSFSLSLIE